MKNNIGGRFELEVDEDDNYENGGQWLIAVLILYEV